MTTEERGQVWPTSGQDVPDEYSGQPILPGQEVTLTRYILRRIADGSLTRERPPQEAPVEPSGPTGTLRPRRLREREAKGLDPYAKPEAEQAPPPPQQPAETGEPIEGASSDTGLGEREELEKERI
jgi:hypothetical protein